MTPERKRDHRLRERRLKLGKSQIEIGRLAGFPPRGEQSMVSYAERSPNAGPRIVQKIRSALVYLESEKRREREWRRQDDAEAAKVEAVMAAGPSHPDYERVVVDRLVDLLWDGRCEDFDTLAAKVSDKIVQRASDIYLEGGKPVIAPSQASTA